MMPGEEFYFIIQDYDNEHVDTDQLNILESASTCCIDLVTNFINS